jgi:hypothetical protein
MSRDLSSTVLYHQTIYPGSKDMPRENISFFRGVTVGVIIRLLSDNIIEFFRLENSFPTSSTSFLQ